MAGWEESADRPGLAAPVLRPGDTFPPRPPNEERRRPRWPIWVALVVVLALAAGLVVYATGRTSKPSQAEQVAAVRKAYLAWWQARKQAYRQLDAAPMRNSMTAAGLKMESAELAQQGNRPIDIVIPHHDLQIVIFRDSDYASVDDILESKSVTIDPTTHQPTSQQVPNFGEQSITLRLVGEKWLVDDQINFGSSDGASDTPICYAAVPGDRPSPGVRSQVVTAFHTFESVRAAAYLRLDPSGLGAVELQPYLGNDQQLLSEQVAKNDSVRYTLQENYRLGVQDATHVWIYDSLLEQNQLRDRTTGKVVDGTKEVLDYFAYEMTRGDGGWMVSNAERFSSS